MAGYIGSKVAVVSSGAERKKVFTATSGQTSFTGLSYTVNNVHVFQNGVRLVDGTDYTATNGNSITLTVGAATDDQVVVVSYNTFQTSDTVSASTGGTFSNAVTIDADGSTVLTVDRATSDGTIIDLQKSGSSVGSIGSEGNGGTFFIGSGDVTLGFNAASDIIIPRGTNAANRTGAIDLGNANNRFKDLYLSGGVFLGGTGSANKLDDYEEGTWTPTIGTEGGSNYTLSSSAGYYTKVGNLVCVEAAITFTAEGSGTITIISLPFTPAGTTEIFNGYVSSGTNNRSIQLFHYSGASVLVRFDDGGAYINYWTSKTEWSPTNTFTFSGTYRVS